MWSFGVFFAVSLYNMLKNVELTVILDTMTLMRPHYRQVIALRLRNLCAAWISIHIYNKLWDEIISIFIHLKWEYY